MLAILQLPVVMVWAAWRAQQGTNSRPLASLQLPNKRAVLVQKNIAENNREIPTAPARRSWPRPQIENEGQVRRARARKASRKLRVNNQEGNQGGNREETCEGNRANREVTCESSPKQRGGLP